MKKQIFKIEDRVFDISYGWGSVVSVEDNKTCSIYVEFTGNNEGNNYKYKIWYQNTLQNRSLSFTEYTLEGFSQKRPKEPLPFENGDVVYLSFTENSEVWVCSKLKIYMANDVCLFLDSRNVSYKFLALENPLLFPNTKIYSHKDL